MEPMAGKIEAGHGLVAVADDICKGCGLCVAACPVKVLTLSNQINLHGYQPASYRGAGCTACGICFYVCPEPGALTIFSAPKSGHSSAESRLT